VKTREKACLPAGRKEQMRNIIFVLTALLFLGMPFASQDSTAQVGTQEGTLEIVEVEETPEGEVFKVYTEKFAGDNHYIPSGWMGDHGDIELDDACRQDPHSGKTCIKIAYRSKRSQGAGWIGIYWQSPANNWGDQMGGYDLTGYTKLTFWARGEKGEEVINEFKIGGVSGMYSDSDSTAIGPVTLTKEWKEYEIPLKGLDLSYIIGGLGLAASLNNNPDGFTIYLDDIKYKN